MSERDGAHREPGFEVVWPLGRSALRDLQPAPGLTTLQGKTICELWDWVFRGDEIYRILNDALREQHPTLRIVGHEVFGNTHGKNEKEYLAELPGRLRELGCDAVISGVGA